MSDLHSDPGVQWALDQLRARLEMPRDPRPSEPAWRSYPTGLREHELVVYVEADMDSDGQVYLHTFAGRPVPDAVREWLTQALESEIRGEK